MPRFPLMSRTGRLLLSAAQSPWRRLVIAVRGQRIVVTLEPYRYSVAWVSASALRRLARLWSGRHFYQVIARLEQELSFSDALPTVSGAVPELNVELLERVLSQIPTAWRAAPCQVVVSSAWIQWGDIPWLGSGLTLGERMTLCRKRLTALYGESHDRRMAIDVARYGQTQLAAGMSPTLLADLQRTFRAANFRVTAIEPVHTLAWNAYAVQLQATEVQGHADRLFVSIEDSTLTLSWLRHVATASKGLPSDSAAVIRGIRNISLERQDTEADASEAHRGSAEAQLRQSIERQIRRECVLQRLVNPVVCVLNRGAKTPWCAQEANLYAAVAGTFAGCHCYAVEDWFEGRGRAIDQATAARKHGTPVSDDRANPWRFFMPRAALKPIHLDFVGQSTLIGPTAWQRWLLAMAVACACAVGAAYAQWGAMLKDTKDALELTNNEERDRNSRTNASLPVMSAAQKEEHAQWQKVHRGLLRPWERLFQCIESSVGSDVTLMQIQPDAQSGELLLTGDARTYKAIGKFVQALQDNSTTAVCANVGTPMLRSYQVNEQDPQRTVHFDISGTWRMNLPDRDSSEPVTGSLTASGGGGKP